jgi:hypothetical protein
MQLKEMKFTVIMRLGMKQNYIFFQKDSSIKTYPLMIFAYNRSEDITTAVPVDIIEMNEAHDKSFGIE